MVNEVRDTLGHEVVMQPVFGHIATSILFGIIHVGPDRRYLIWTVLAVAVGFVFGRF